MKKFLYSILLAVLPVMAVSLASCNDDDKLPDVKISLEVSGGTIANGTIYVEQGDTLNVEALTVANNEAGKSAALANVSYFMNNVFLGRSLFNPYPMPNITTENTPVGDYTLSISCDVLAVDKSMAVGAFAYPVKVVPANQPLPAGTTSAVVTVSPK